MLLDYLHGGLHNWAVFCCTVATLGLIGAGILSVGICFGKGALGFLNGSGRQPQVIIVHEGGRYQPQPQKRTWGLGRTYLLFAAIFSGGPMLTLLLMAANSAAQAGVDWVAANWWVLLVVPVAVLLVGAFWWVIKHDREQEPEPYGLPAVVEPQPVAPMWTAPVVEGN